MCGTTYEVQFFCTEQTNNVVVRCDWLPPSDSQVDKKWAASVCGVLRVCGGTNCTPHNTYISTYKPNERDFNVWDRLTATWATNKHTYYHVCIMCHNLEGGNGGYFLRFPLRRKTVDIKQKLIPSCTGRVVRRMRHGTPTPPQKSAETVLMAGIWREGW